MDKAKFKKMLKGQAYLDTGYYSRGRVKRISGKKPFDQDRFEAMFRAVIASGVKINFEFCKAETKYFITQLDAYYATKKGGNNE
jgi:hypothetical protein